jgi:hypothetical protein
MPAFAQAQAAARLIFLHILKFRELRTSKNKGRIGDSHTPYSGTPEMSFLPILIYCLTCSSGSFDTVNRVDLLHWRIRIFLRFSAR